MTINWVIAFPTTTSGSATYIANMPFTVGTAYTEGGSHGYVNGSSTVAAAHITATSSSLLYRTANGGVLLTYANFSNTLFRGTLTYQTA